MKEKPLLFLVYLTLASLAFIFSAKIKGQHLSFLESRAISVFQEQTPLSQPTPTWSLLDKILAPDLDFDNTQLNVGDKDIIYYEERFLRDEYGNIKYDLNGLARIERKLEKDPEREIALKLLNLNTGDTEAIKIKKEGQELITPPGYTIEVVKRPSGITWNGHNTFYKVLQPADTVVIRNVWPLIKYTKKTVKNNKGKKVKTNVPVFDKNKSYIPYSEALQSPETIQKGIDNLKLTITEAKEQLRKNGVMSKTFPNRFVADVLPDEYYWRRPIIEQSDLGEFIFDPEDTVTRFFVILGTNGRNAWTSCNYADACGWLQFTPNTYKNVVSKYKAANLIKDFKDGSYDHVNAAMAAMLLDDLNLESLVDAYGNKIYNDPRIEEYLAASYNGAPKWVHKSLNATIGKNINDWTKHLRPETKGFMVKLRYLRDDDRLVGQ